MGLAACASLAAASRSGAAFGWWDGFGPQGIDGPIEALVLDAGTVVAGGSFERVGGAPAAHVARWDGLSWSSLGGGLPDPVHALAMHEGTIVAASDSAERLMSWNGIAWVPHPASTGAPIGIAALASWNGLLVAGGSFTSLDGAPASHLASWNGATWAPFAGGANGSVSALASDGSLLCAGGSFTSVGEGPSTPAHHIAGWDGSEWTALGAGIPGVVKSLAPLEGALLAGGTFPASAPTEPAPHLLAWAEGEWKPESPSPNAPVLALAAEGSTLFAAGNFTWVGSASVAEVAARDATTWASLDGASGGAGIQGWSVFDLDVHQGELVVAGLFEWAGDRAAAGAARWNGASWEPFVSAGSIATKNLVSVASVAGAIVACGNFVENGATLEQRVAQWDGSSWVSLGTGINSYVWSFAEFEDDLIIGGVFSIAGGSVADRVARWDGTTWSSLGTHPPDGPVYALRPFAGGLVAGGHFEFAGDEAASGIALWDGIGWGSFAGSGVSGGAFAEVTAFEIDGSSLIVVGEFDAIDGVPARSVARWDGSSWAPIGEGIDGHLQGVTFVGSDLVVAGVPGVFRWDGTRWEDLEIDAGAAVLALQSFQGALFAGGSFLSAGGAASLHIARWDPATEVAAPPSESATALCALPSPNPFRASVAFTVAASPSPLRVAVHDVRGRLVRRLFEGLAESDLHLDWDGCDRTGRTVAPGVYYLRVEAGPVGSSFPIVRLR